MNPQLQSLKKYLESEEGKAFTKRYIERMANKQLVRQRWIEKIHTHYGNDIDSLTEKLMDKYYSDVYRDREYYKCKCEPREPLLWLLMEYAETYGKKCKNKKYYNMFTGVAYYLGSYVIQTMHGQGSVIRIDKK
jgi:hypothetical protein